MPNLLGIDVGTTSMKAVLFDENGSILKSVTKDYTLITSGDRVELEAKKYRDMLFEALDEIKSEYSIDALSIDTQCETMIVTDADGEPLYNAIVWLVNRAANEAEMIAGRFSLKEVFEVTGQSEITATWPASKLLWLRENEPEVFKKIEKVFLLEDYLLYMLTGEFVTEKTLQSSSLYLDIRSGKWWQEMLDFIGVDQNKLPRLMNSGEVIGTYDGTSLKRVVGPEIETFEMLEMQQRYEKITDEEKDAVIKNAMSKWHFLREAKPEGLKMAAGYYLAVKQIIDERGYGAISLKDVDGMKKLLGFPPAPIFMLLSDEAKVSTIPENDCLGNVTALHHLLRRQHKKDHRSLWYSRY